MPQSRLNSTLSATDRNMEATSVMRTNKARAQAAQHLMLDTDGTLPLPPLDPSQRISLHRQLRSRYNPTQTPFSALSCSRYITAADVAQLANLFQEFSLFIPTAAAAPAAAVVEAVPSRAQRDGASAGGGAGRGMSLGSAAPAAKGEAAATPSPPTGRGKLKAVGDVKPGKRLTAVSPAAAQHKGSVNTEGVPVSSWRTGVGVFSGSGMTLLQEVVEPPPSPPPPPSHTSGRSAVGQHGNGARSAGPASPLPPVQFPAASLGTAATTAAAAAAAARELAEPFTAESDDSALTVEWLVEVLLEMMLQNTEAGRRRGKKTQPADGDASGGDGGGSDGQRRTPSANVSCGGELASMSLGGLSVAGAVSAAALSTASYQARHRETRTELLASARAELVAWAEHLQQPCSQQEHLSTWQQCALQAEVLARYRRCVVHASATATTAAAHGSLPSFTSDGSPHTAAAAGVGAAYHSMTTEPTASLTGQRPEQLRMRRANVSWRIAPPAAQLSFPHALSGGGSAERESPSLPAKQQQQLRSAATTAAVSAAVREGAGADTEGGTEESAAASLDGSVIVVQSLAPAGDGDGEATDSTAASPTQSPPTCPRVASALAAVTEAHYLAAKVRGTAPRLKDLLLRPAELNSFLWESPAARELAMEEEHKAQQLQHARSALSVQFGGEAAGQPAGDAPRAASASDGPSRPSSPHPRQPQHQPSRRRRAAAEQRLVCWSDVASNLLMGLETTWTREEGDLAYVRVPTALLEDLADGARGTGRGGKSSTLQRRRSSAIARHALAAASKAAGASSSTAFAAEPSAAAKDDGTDSDDDGAAAAAAELPLGAAGRGGQCRRRRLHPTGGTHDAMALQQRAVMLSSLGVGANAAMRSLHATAADHVVVSPSQKHIVTSSKDGMLKVWEADRGQFLATILNVEQAWVLHMTFLHGGEYLLVATTAAEVTVVNFPQGGVVLKMRGCTSLATALVVVKQPSTVHTQRFGMKPGECGSHKPIAPPGTTVAEYHAAAAARAERQIDLESEPMAARPLVGYVTPTSAYYEEELGMLFFGTLSGMVGCVDLSEPLSRSGLLAAAAGVRWTGPLYVHDSVYAHPDTAPAAAAAAALSPSASDKATALATTATATDTKGITRAGAGAAAASTGLHVNGVFYCGVGHCVVSSDCNGAIVRTSFTANANTSLVSLGTPAVVMEAGRPIRFMACCSGGRRFVTVHSDRRALLWSVGRTVTELVHQYPQAAYDIADACFLGQLQQVALLMADRSVCIFDERGTRPITTIAPPRGASSRVEDMASITLKYSAEDGEGCVAYVAGARRIVCGLRGPVLYEPAPPAVHAKPAKEGSGESGQKQEQQQQQPTAWRGSGDAAVDWRAPLPHLKPSGLDSTARQGDGDAATFLLPAVTPPSSARAAARPRSAGRSADSPPSASSAVGEGGEPGDFEGRLQERERRRVREQKVTAALLRAQHRLLPFQTHTTAVVGLVLDTERHELHSLSTDTWVVWNYTTGAQVRAPVHVPAVVERDLALRRRSCRVTCGAWSSVQRTRLLLGTRDSRVLTVDAAVGTVVSATDPLAAPSQQRQEETAMEDRDVGVMACCGTRTLLCRGRVCEVRRYELTSPLLPSGEEAHVAMHVCLPTTAPAHLGAEASAAAAGAATAVVPAAAGTAVSARRAEQSRAMPHSNTRGPPTVLSPRSPQATAVEAASHDQAHGATSSSSSTTITACCVVRESFLCLGTSDTKLYFYRMVDRSSPVHVEVLRDAAGEADVGRVLSLHYVHNKTQDVVLAVVDTGALHVYSSNLQRVVARYSFPALGTATAALVPSNASDRRRTRIMATAQPQQSSQQQQRDQEQQHYLTCVSLTDDASGSATATTATAAALGASSGAGTGGGAASQRQLTMCCGDSTGYVHIIALASVLADAAAAAASAATQSAAGGLRHRELRFAVSFRAATAGVSALEAMRGGRVASWLGNAGGSTIIGRPDTGGSAAASSTSSASSLIVFAGGFDGNVRVFCVVVNPYSPSAAAPRLSATVSGIAMNATLGLPGAATSMDATFPGMTGSFASSRTVASTRGAAGEQRTTIHIPHGPDKAVQGSERTATSPLVSPSTQDTEEGDGDTLQPQYNSNYHYTAMSMLATTAAPGGLAARYVPVTVGLCGVDAWDLRDADTFSDVRRVAFLMDLEEDDAHEGLNDEPLPRLPSILDSKEDELQGCDGSASPGVVKSDRHGGKGGEADRRSDGGGGGTAEAASRRRASVSVDSGVSSGGAVLLLRDVLRQSKRHLAPAAAAASETGHGREGGVQLTPTRQTSGPSKGSSTGRGVAGSQRGLQGSSPPVDALFTGSSRSASGGAGTFSAVSHLRCASPFPSLTPRAKEREGEEGPLPLLYTPCTIGELVSRRQQNSTKTLTLPQLHAALAELAAAGLLTEALGTTQGGAAEGRPDSPAALAALRTRPAAPRSQQKNPLVRTYPVALLRQMGVLHPQDPTPDVDPTTGLPMQLSAEEAFRPWERAASVLTAAVAPEAEAAEGDRGRGRSDPPEVSRALTPTFVDADDASFSPPSLPSSAAHAGVLVAAAVPVTLVSPPSIVSAGPSADARRAGPLNDASLSSNSGAGGSGEHRDEGGLLPPQLPSLVAGQEEGAAQPRGSVSTDHDTEVPDSSRNDDNEGDDDDVDDEDGADVQEVSVFLTEAHVGSRHSRPPPPQPHLAKLLPTSRRSTTTATNTTIGDRRSTATTAATATTANTPHSTFTAAPSNATTAVPRDFLSQCDAALSAVVEPEADAGPAARRASVSMPDVLVTSIFNVSPMAAAANIGWNAAQQQVLFAEQTSEEANRTRRGRPSQNSERTLTQAPLITPPPSQHQQQQQQGPAAAERELAVLRTALQDVHPDVLAMREDQMMLAHAAGQLDRALRRPQLSSASTASAHSSASRRRSHSPRIARAAGSPSVASNDALDSEDGARGVGAFTARLLRVWRQRSGDAAVEAAAALAAVRRPPAFPGEGGEGATGCTAAAPPPLPPSSFTVSTARRSTAGSALSRRSVYRAGGGFSAASSRSKTLQRVPSNAMLAVAAARQATPGTGYGLDLFTLTLPNEPLQLTPRQAAATARGSVGRRSSGGGGGGGAAAAASAAAAATAAPLVLPPRSARAVPAPRMQQQLHPVTVTLPSTLRRDEGERVGLRRLETAVSDHSRSSSKR